LVGAAAATYPRCTRPNCGVSAEPAHAICAGCGAACPDAQKCSECKFLTDVAPGITHCSNNARGCLDVMSTLFRPNQPWTLGIRASWSGRLRPVARRERREIMPVRFRSSPPGAALAQSSKQLVLRSSPDRGSSGYARGLRDRASPRVFLAGGGPAALRGDTLYRN
jgi:hypothetical protein